MLFSKDWSWAKGERREEDLKNIYKQTENMDGWKLHYTQTWNNVDGVYVSVCTCDCEAFPGCTAVENVSCCNFHFTLHVCVWERVYF